MERKKEDFSDFLKPEGKDPLFQTARRLCSLVRKADGRALFVGGCVRDLLLGLPVREIDIECYGLPAEKLIAVLKDDFLLDPVGISFGILKIRHQPIDVALPRRENKQGSGHRGFLIGLDPSLTIAEAAARRDFTVNAMLWDPLNGEFFDPWHGREDLANKILRHVSVHFSEDPLRVLRAMQFAARFDFTVAPETVELCQGIGMEGLAKERIAGEWDKMLLLGTHPSAGLHFLLACRWAAFFPGLTRVLENPETGAAMDAAASWKYGSKEEQRLFMLARLALFFPDEKTIEAFVRSIWPEKELTAELLPLIRHAKALLTPLSASQLRRLSVLVRRPPLWLALGRTLAGDPPCAAFSFNAGAMRTLGISQSPPSPLVGGKDLLVLGFPPGKEMGKTLKMLFDAQLDGKFSDLPGAIDFLRRRK